MADWKTLWEKWDELSPELKRKIEDAMEKQDKAGKLEAFYKKEPYARMIAEKILGAKAGVQVPAPVMKKEVIAETPKPLPKELPPMFKVGDTVTHMLMGKGRVEGVERTKPPYKPGYSYNVHFDSGLSQDVMEEDLQPVVMVPAEELKPGEGVKTGPRFKPGDKVIYRWTGEEYTIKAVTSWPSVLVEDKYGHLIAKDEFQLVTAEEYETLKEQEKEKAEEKKKGAPRVGVATPKLPGPERIREREAVLRDLFYAALSKAGVPIKEGYRARWRLEMPKILKAATVEEQQNMAEDYAKSIIDEYSSEQKFRRQRYTGTREERAVPLQELVPGLQPEMGTPKEEEVLLQDVVERRCNHRDHEDEAWRKAHPKIQEDYPDGLFFASLVEERAAFNLPVPGYFRNRRFNGFCPWHRHTEFGAYITTVGKWVEVYLWMYKVSAGRQGMDPGIVRAANLDPGKFDHPITWHPPSSIFDYWKLIGWRAPSKIEDVWDKEEKGEPAEQAAEELKKESTPEEKEWWFG